MAMTSAPITITAVSEWVAAGGRATDIPASKPPASMAAPSARALSIG